MHWRVIPWLTEPAIAFLDAYLDSTHRVLEFGAGGSSIWMAPRCHTLVTVEHDSAWLERVAPHVEEDTWSPLLRPLPYDSVCDQWSNGEYDLVLIDGRGRVACAEASARLVRPGGVLMLDNAERGGYAAIGDVLCKDWNIVIATQRQKDSEGFVYENWTTTWWVKP